MAAAVTPMVAAWNAGSKVPFWRKKTTRPAMVASIALRPPGGAPSHWPALASGGTLRPAPGWTWAPAALRDDMTPTVLLFDIDGTLVTTGGVGRRALEQAFDQAYGRKDACAHFSFGGMTDRAIARQGLAAIDVEPTPERIEALLALYVRELEAEVARADMRRYLVHRGVPEALAAAEARGAGFAMGLGTGNIREGARVKLQRVGLHERFRFGGFGCDHEDRPTLIRHGAERGAADPRRFRSPTAGW